MEADSFTTLNVAILVLAAGKLLTRKIRFLRDFNIPEPVTGGLLACLVLAVVFAVSGTEVGFTLATRDFLLLYFFAAIGLNSDFKTLVSGGKPLLVLLALTIAFMVTQNVAGVGIATALGLDPLVGLVGGSVSLIGGHGTTIAWAPIFVEDHAIENALEIGIACATMGLVLASLMGGPVARILISRHNLQPTSHEPLDVGVAHEVRHQEVGYFSILRTIFWLNISLVLGNVIKAVLDTLGTNFPLFVCCLFGAILLTNSVPRIFPKLPWPSRSRALALVSDGALGIFLTMSLMSLQLWTLVSLAGPILAILAVQFFIAFAFAIFLVFRCMGRDYESAVIAAGFGGFSLGATPTAMANMTAVAQKYGPAHRAFIIVPLVSGFFIDISNALVIGRFLAWFGA